MHSNISGVTGRPHKILLGVAAAGMAMCLLIDVTASLDDHISREPVYEWSALALGLLLGWAPYAAAALTPRIFSLPGRGVICLAGGLALYALIDGHVRYKVQYHPASSTDAVAIIMVLMSSVVIIPGGAVLTSLILPRGRG